MIASQAKRRNGGPVLGVSVCVVRDGRVLLTQRAKRPFENLWSLPGGRVEAGEKLAEAALRELREETAVEARLRGIFDWAEIIDAERHMVIAVFLADWTAGEAAAASDVKAVRWAKLKDAGELSLTPGLLGILRKALAR
jgi:mutator protein MutT